MADNTVLLTGGGGDTIRTIDRAGTKTQVTQLDWGGEAGPEQLVVLANGLPVQPATGSTWAVTNAALTSIDAKTPALGQQVAAASSPVVLTAAQIATLTPFSTVAVTNLDVALSTRLKAADTLAGVTTVNAVTSITNALPAGTNLLGKVGIDQTTPGTTNKVSGSDSLGQVQYNFPAGFVRTTDEPRQLFYDPFDTFDLVNRWNASSSGAVAPSITTGVMTMGSGTGTGYSYLESKPSFTPTIPGWLSVSFAISLENPLTTGAVRFWGCGTTPANPTAAVPITDGYGFELTTTGTLECVVYASGVRTSIATITGSLTDALSHRYIINYRTDRIFFYFDSLATPVATASFQGPNQQILPVKIQVVGNSAASSRVISCTGLAVADSAKNNTTISDGTFGWRKMTVNTDGSVNTKPINGALETGNLSYLSLHAEQNAQIIKLLSAILMTLGNNGNGFVDPEEARDLSTLQ